LGFLIALVLCVLSWIGEIRDKIRRHLEEFNKLGDSVLGKPFLPSSEGQLEKFYMWMYPNMPRYFRAQYLKRNVFEELYAAYGKSIYYTENEYFGEGWDDYKEVTVNLYDKNAEITCNSFDIYGDQSLISLAFCYQVFLVHQKTA
jgi:hypothetical protein